MVDDDTPAKTPRPCPICSVPMQATETEERIVHKCHNCGMILSFALPPTREKLTQY
jgi:hypothetical protein